MADGVALDQGNYRRTLETSGHRVRWGTSARIGQSLPCTAAAVQDQPSGAAAAVRPQNWLLRHARRIETTKERKVGRERRKSRLLSILLLALTSFIIWGVTEL